MLKLCLILTIISTQLLGHIAQVVPSDNEGTKEHFSEEELWNENEEEPIEGGTAAAMDPRTKPPNEFVDFVLDTLKTVLKIGGNEIPLPDTNQYVQEQIWGITFRIRTRLFDGKVKGLQSIRRLGEASYSPPIHKSFGSIWYFDTEMKDVELNYGFSFQLMGLGPRGHMKGLLDSITIGLKLKVSPEGGLSIDDFDVKEVGEFTVRTSGLGNFNQIVNQIAGGIGNGVKGLILESMEDQLKEFMNQALARVSVVV